MKFARSIIRGFADLLYTLRKEKVHKLVIAFVFIIFLFGAVVYQFEKDDPNSTIKNIYDGMWWSIVTFATVGYGDKYPITWQGKITGIILIISALILTVIISGTIASILVERKMREGKGLQKIEFTDHIIICGANRALERILNDFQKLCHKVREEINIVLINELETDALSEYQFTYSSKLLKIDFIRGNYTHEQVLEKANVRKAKSVIILADQAGGDKNMQNSDERTVLASYTISNLNPGAQISVELINHQNEQYLKRMNIGNIIVYGEFNSFFLVNAALFPGVPQAAKEILNFDFENDITAKNIPPALIGKNFADLSRFFREKEQAILIGIIADTKKLSIDDFLSDDPSSIDDFIKRKFAESEKDFFADTGGKLKVTINPGWNYIIQENDRAVVIGEVGNKKMTEFEKFKNISILSGIPDEEIKALFDSCSRVTFQQNDIIMEEDEDKHSMFFFIDGEVIISNTITMKVSNQAGFSEVEKSLVRLKAETVGVIGEMSMFEEQARSATVKAFNPCTLYEIDKAGFETFIASYPAIGVKILYNIARVLSARVRRGNSDTLKLTTALSIALSK